MANKKLSPQDADAGRARNARSGGRRPNTQRPTEKSMTLYTMSGKRTTIEERDSTTEEERMAEVRARLFTLFDDDDEREREYAEQNGLKNRATGTFQKIKSIIGDEDENSDETVSRNSADRSPENKTNVSNGAERRKPVIPEQRRQRSEPSGQEQTGKKRIEQERRVKPVTPVRAMDAEKFERRGKPESGDRARRPSGQDEDGGRVRRPSGQGEDGGRARRPSNHGEDSGRVRKSSDHAASEYTESVATRAKPKETESERTAISQHGYDRAESSATGRQPDSPDESFRLGDLFKDKEPDIFSRWEQEDETEKRMRERRERRRAEAAKRGRGEDDDSKMKTAAALFIAREGMKNFFGKFSGTTFRDQEQDEEERAAEEALRELAAARATEDASSLDGNGTTARAAEDAASLDGSETPASAAVDDDNKPGIPKTNRDADKRSKASERPVAKTKAKASDETGKKKRPAAATKKEEAPRAKRVKDVEQSTVPKRSKKRESQETRTDSSGAETGTAAMKMKAARPAVDSSENTGDAARPEPQLLDYFTGGARLSKSAIAWMAGGAAGSVAVVVIATVIVNSHVIGL